MSGLPHGWALVDLETLAGPNGLMSDGDWIESADQDPEGDVRLIQLADIGVGEFRDKSNRFLTSVKAAELRCTNLRPGDVLIARMPDPIGRAAVFPGLRQQAITAVDVMIWRSDGQLANPNFVVHLMNSSDVRASVQAEAGGTTRQRIAGGRLKTLKLPMPSLAEQRRIVAKIDALSARSKRARADLDRVEALAARAKDAVLSKAFVGDLTSDWRERNPDKSAHTLLKEINASAVENPDGLSLPAGWAWLDAGTLCDVKGGLALGKKRAEGAELVERPYLRVANVQRGWLNLDEIKTVLVSPDEARSMELAAGDVLMNEGGDRDKLGRGWVWEGQIHPCIHQNHVFRLRPRSSRVPSKFISL